MLAGASFSLLLAAAFAAAGGRLLVTASQTPGSSGTKQHGEASAAVAAAVGDSQLAHRQAVWKMEAATHTASLVIRSMYCQLEPGRPCDLPDASHVSAMREWASKDPGWERILSSLSLYELARRFWQQQDSERALSAVEQSIALKLFPYTDTAQLSQWQQSLVRPGALFKRPKLELADSLILKANALFELGRRDSSVEHLYQALEAIHLSAALMHSSMDLVPEVLQHLETLSTHVGTTTADILQRMKMGKLQDLMARHGVSCKGCSERYEFVQQLAVRLSLPVEVQPHGGQVQGSSSAFMQRAYARQPHETTAEFMQRLFAQLVGMVHAQYWEDLGLTCTLPGPVSNQCTSYLPAWVYKDQGWAAGLQDMPEQQDGTWQAGPSLTFTLPPEAAMQPVEFLPSFIQAAAAAAAAATVPAPMGAARVLGGQAARSLQARAAGCASEAWQRVAAGGQLEELLRAVQVQFAAGLEQSSAAAAGGSTSKLRSLPVEYSQCRGLLLGASGEATPSPPPMGAWPPARLALLPPLQSVPPLPAKDHCCPTFRRRKPADGVDTQPVTNMSAAMTAGSQAAAGAAGSVASRADPAQPDATSLHAPQQIDMHDGQPHEAASTGGQSGGSSSSSSLRQAFDKHLQEHLDYLTQGYQYSQDDPIVVVTLTGVTLAVVLAVSFTKNRKRVSRFLAEHRTLLQLHVSLSWVLPGSSGGPGAGTTAVSGMSLCGSGPGGPMAGSMVTTSQQRRVLAAVLRDAMLGSDMAKLENAIAAAEAASLEIGLVTRAKQALAQRRRRDRERNAAATAATPSGTRKGGKSSRRHQQQQSAQQQQQQQTGGLLSSNSAGGALGMDVSSRSYSTRDSSTSSVQGYGEETEEVDTEERGTTIWTALCMLLGSFSVKSVSSSNPTSPSYSVQSVHEVDALAADAGRSEVDGEGRGAGGDRRAGSPGLEGTHATSARDMLGDGWRASQVKAANSQQAGNTHTPRDSSPRRHRVPPDNSYSIHDTANLDVDCDTDDGWQQHVSRPRRNRTAKAAAAERVSKASAPASHSLRANTPLLSGSRIPLPNSNVGAATPAKATSAHLASQPAGTPSATTGSRPATTFMSAVTGQPAKPLQTGAPTGRLPADPTVQPPSKHTRSQRSGGWLDWISGSVLLSSSSNTAAAAPTDARQAAGIPATPPPPPPPRASPAKQKQKAWGSHANSELHVNDASLLQTASPIRTAQVPAGGGKQRHKHAAQPHIPHPDQHQASAAPAYPNVGTGHSSTTQPDFSQPSYSSFLGTSPTGKSAGFISTLSSWMGYGHSHTACHSPAAGIVPHAAPPTTYSSITASTTQSLVGSPLPSSVHDAANSADNASSNSGSGCFSSLIAALPASLTDAPTLLHPPISHPHPVAPSSRPLNPAAPSFRSLRHLTAGSDAGAPYGSSTIPASNTATMPANPGAPSAAAMHAHSHSQRMVAPLSGSVVCSNLTGLQHTPAAVAAAAAASQRLRHDPFAEPLALRKQAILPSLHHTNHHTNDALMSASMHSTHPASGLLPSSLTFHTAPPASSELMHHTASFDNTASPAVSTGGLTPSAGGSLAAAAAAQTSLQTFSMFAANSVWSPSVVTSGTHDGGWGQLPDVAAAMTASSAAWGGVSSGTGVTCSLAGGAPAPLPCGVMPGLETRISNSPSLEDLHGLGDELQANDLAQDIMRHVVEC